MPRKRKSVSPAPVVYPEQPETINPCAGLLLESTTHTPLAVAYSEPENGIWLYNENCLAVMDAIARKYPDGLFDMIFADPPYFLSNGGITCQAGKMVKVDKGSWDKSRGAELNHEFNLEWLSRCQKVLKPNGTIWVSGTHHVIFSVGYAMQQLGFKILNDITWEKPNPPPNLSCRYFTHSTETVIWAAKNSKSKHCFNYSLMKETNGGKQMKTVWRIPAPSKGEKAHGKHPTQKPAVLIERCLAAATIEGDSILDPFLGSGASGVAAIRKNRRFCGIELDTNYAGLASRRMHDELLRFIHRWIRVTFRVEIFSQKDLDPFSGTIHGSGAMPDEDEVAPETIYHETKFLFLSCSQVSKPGVVHTTVDVSVKDAWKHTPQHVKQEITHVIRCETEILKLKKLQSPEGPA